jgi:hypothetical protein
VALLSVGCSGGCSEEQLASPGQTVVEAVRYEVPPINSVGTLRGLGPHLWEATYERRGDEQGLQPSRDSVARLVWADLDTYQFLQIDSGELVHDEIRLGRDIYRRHSDQEPYLLKKGVPGDSMILHRTMNMWQQAIAPFADQLAYERQDDGTVEGRAVRVYRLRLVPVPAVDVGGVVSPDKSATLMGIVTSPISLEGAVYVDVETGNRLLAELEGRFAPRASLGGGDLADEVLISYRESRSLTGVPAEVKAPSAGDVFDPALARSEAARRARRLDALDRQGGQ